MTPFVHFVGGVSGAVAAGIQGHDIGTGFLVGMGTGAAATILYPAVGKATQAIGRGLLEFGHSVRESVYSWSYGPMEGREDIFADWSRATTSVIDGPGPDYSEVEFPTSRLKPGDRSALDAAIARIERTRSIIRRMERRANTPDVIYNLPTYAIIFQEIGAGAANFIGGGAGPRPILALADEAIMGTARAGWAFGKTGAGQGFGKLLSSVIDLRLDFPDHVLQGKPYMSLLAEPPPAIVRTVDDVSIGASPL